MRITNLKTHLTFIGIMIASVVIVFYATGQFDAPAPAQPTVVAKNPILIQVASWGLNCLEMNTQTLKELQKHASTATGEAYDDLSKKIEALQPLPSRNNVLDRIKTACSGQSPCTIDLKDPALELQSNDYCSQELTITYLCHAYDILRDAKISGDEPLTLDCSDEAQNESPT